MSQEGGQLSQEEGQVSSVPSEFEREDTRQLAERKKRKRKQEPQAAPAMANRILNMPIAVTNCHNDLHACWFQSTDLSRHVCSRLFVRCPQLCIFAMASTFVGHGHGKPIRTISHRFTNRQEQTCLHWPVDWNKHTCKTL